MRKLLLVCLFVTGISAVSFAQGQRMSPEQRVAALKTSLALNDDQAAKITAIYTVRAKSIDSLMTASNGDMQGMMKNMQPITDKTNAKVKALLTTDQAAIFQKQVDEQAAMMKQRMAGGN
jgi:protein CpxP